jgi:hypothetical protein
LLYRGYWMTLKEWNRNRHLTNIDVP